MPIITCERAVRRKSRSRARQIRDDYCRLHVPSSYSGPVHLCLTLGIVSAALAGCLFSLQDVTGLEWLTVPATFVYANLVEYLGHRGPMHHRQRAVPSVFEGHCNIHHRFYTVESFAYESTRDWHALLLPPYLIFFFGLFAAPAIALLHVTLG